MHAITSIQWVHSTKTYYLELRNLLKHTKNLSKPTTKIVPMCFSIHKEFNYVFFQFLREETWPLRKKYQKPDFISNVTFISEMGKMKEPYVWWQNIAILCVVFARFLSFSIIRVSASINPSLIHRRWSVRKLSSISFMNSTKRRHFERNLHPFIRLWLEVFLYFKILRRELDFCMSFL